MPLDATDGLVKVIVGLFDKSKLLRENKPSFDRGPQIKKKMSRTPCLESWHTASELQTHCNLDSVTEMINCYTSQCFCKQQRIDNIAHGLFAKHTSKQASQPASQPASSNHANKQASKQASKQAVGPGGGASPKRLYKAPTDYTKPQKDYTKHRKTIQRPEILYI